MQGSWPTRRSAMKKKRNRSRPPQPLQERLKQIALGAREKAAGLPPGHERDRLLETAVSTESAAAIERWLSSPGLPSPKYLPPRAHAPVRPRLTPRLTWPGRR